MVACMHSFMQKVQKCVYLPIDVADNLEENDNQSETVEEALRYYWRNKDATK